MQLLIKGVFLYFKSGHRPMALSGGNINRCLVYFMFLCFVFVSYFVFFNFVALWGSRAINFMAESQRWNLSLTLLMAGV